MATLPNETPLAPDAQTSVQSGPLTLTFAAGATNRPVRVRLATGASVPPLPSNFHPRLTFAVSVDDLHPPAVASQSSPPPSFTFRQGGRLRFSYAGLEDPGLPSTSLQVMMLGTRYNWWTDVGADFDHQAKTAEVAIWHEGTYALVANAALVPLAPVQAMIGSGGGSLDFDRLHITFPPGALPEDCSVTIAPPKPPLTPWLGGLRFPFEVIARSVASGKEIHQLGATVRFQVGYEDAELGSFPLDELEIRSYDEKRESWSGLPTSRDATSRLLRAESPHLSAFSTGGNTVENPFDFGTDWVHTDTFTGAVSFAMPFEVPNGSGGLKPDLKLVFNSQASHWAQRANILDGANGGKGLQTASWVGEGFDIPIGQVQKVGDPKVGGQYYYSVSIFGQSYRLDQDSGGSWHTQDEQFWKIDQNKTDPTNGVSYAWRVITPDGTKYYFGTDALESDRMVYYDFSLHSQQACRWMLSRVEDPSGNLIIIDYERLTKNLSCGGAQGNPSMTPAVYPKTIRYGGRDAASLPYALVFNRSSGPLPNGNTLDGGNPGNGVDRADVDQHDWIWDGCTQLYFDIKYLDSLDVLVSGTLARRYKFGIGSGGIPITLGKVSLWSDANGTVQQTLFTTASDVFTYTDTKTAGGSTPGAYRLTTSITNGFGGSVSFTWPSQIEPVGSFQDYQGWSQTPYNGTALVVSQVTRDPGFGGTQQTTAYSVYSSPFGNGNMSWPEYFGHHEVDVTEGTLLTKNYFLQDDVFHGRPSDVSFQDTSVNPPATVRSRHNVWTSDVISSASNFVHLDSTDEYQGSGHKLTQYFYDASLQGGTQYGNRTRTYEYDAATSTTAWLRFTKRFFYPGSDADHHVVNRLAAENASVYDPNNPGGDGILQSQKLRCYDGAANWGATIGSGSSWRGLLTALRRNASAPNATTYQDTTYSYDAFGNRLTESRWNSYGSLSTLAAADERKTTFQYDTTYNAYKISETTPPTTLFLNGLSTTYDYDFVRGRLTSVTDPNQQTTVHQYDALGRRVATFFPGENSLNPGAASIRYDYQIGMNQPTRIQVARRKDGGGGLFGRRFFSWRFYDGFGRLIQTQEDFDRSTVPIRAQDINELSTATGAGVTVSAGTSLIHASDFTTIQTKIGGLWSVATLGSLPGWSSGVTPTGGASATPIFGSDLVDLRQWLNLYQYAMAPNGQRTTWSNSAGTVLVVNKFYDARGLLANESVPHLLSLTVPGRFAGPDLTNDWVVGAHPSTASTYDALKRPLTVTLPNATLSRRWSYNGWSTTLTDENGHATTRTMDILKRLATVQEPTNATTRYAYDQYDAASGFFTQTVTDPAGHVTTVFLDSLGQKRTQVDPDRGTWHSTYNPVGTLQQQTDANGNVVSFTYDNLDRPLTKTVNSALVASYNYDEGTHGKGKRTSASTADGKVSATFTYDAKGRLAQESYSLQLASGSQGFSYTYDAQDRPLTVTYPDGEVVSYQYGDHGKPVALTSSRFGTLIGGVTYNELLKPGQVNWFPNGQTTFTYYGIGGISQSGGRFGDLQKISSALEWWQYTYDAVGNVSSVADSVVNPTAQSATYDVDDRLTASAWSAEGSFGYDDLGNLTNLNGLGLSYTGSPVHAPSAVNGVGYAYDDNGNLTNDGARTYGYDGENRLTSVSVPALGYLYDYDGKRLQRTKGGVTTLYVGERYEIDLSTGETTAYYPWAGQPLPMRQGNNVYLLHADRLGSITNASDATGASVATQRYTAYGSRWAVKSSGTLPTDRGFTGQIRDGSRSNFDFYFYRSRYYNASIGRFVQADSVVPDAKNPQTLNRYAYGLNNPLRMVDPSGHDAMDLNWKNQFILMHGYGPTEQDWRDRQFSLTHPGSGLNGGWTDLDWQSYSYARGYLGRDLLQEIGNTQDHAKELAEIQDATAARFADGVPWIDGPDHTRIYLGGHVPDKEDAWTFGNYIIIGTSVMDRLAAGRMSLKDYHALIIHEYTHVLQYRLRGADFFRVYTGSGLDAFLRTGTISYFGSSLNALEYPAYQLQALYTSDPGLPPTWEFWP